MADKALPKLGLGTLYNTDPVECAGSVTKALEQGYRHIDTAQMYDNETYVGEGLAESDVSRKEIFLATKVHQENLAYEEVLSTTADSLSRLGVDAVNLLYVHWPAEAYDPEETLAAFNELADNGKIRNVGVSNFSLELVDEARSLLDEPILANQVEMHPLLQQEKLLDYCQKNGIFLVAYSPLAKGAVFSLSTMNEIAAKHGINEAQVSLAWLLSKDNVAVIPKARGEHIGENYEALSVNLDEEDLRRIDAIDQEERLADPEFGPWNA